MMLALTHLFVIHAVVAGIVYLVIKRPRAFQLCKFFCLLAILCQLGWLVEAALTIPYCALLDPWGVAAILTLAGIGASWWASRRYQSPRVLIGGLFLVGLATILEKTLLPPPGSSNVTMGWMLAVHILLVVSGYSILAVGCVAGLMIMLRSHTLKSHRWAISAEIPWPSLTTMDRLFVHSVGAGVVILTAGIFMGIALAPGAELKVPWFNDPKAIMTLAGCALYAGVWLLRRRNGFVTRSVVGLSTLGFTFVLLAFFLSGLFSTRFHSF